MSLLGSAGLLLLSKKLSTFGVGLDAIGKLDPVVIFLRRSKLRKLTPEFCKKLAKLIWLLRSPL